MPSRRRQLYALSPAEAPTARTCTRRHAPQERKQGQGALGRLQLLSRSETHSIFPKALEREGGGLNAGGASAVVARLRSGSRIGSDMYLRGNVGAGFGRPTLGVGCTRTLHWRPCSPAPQSHHAAGGGRLHITFLYPR